MNRISDNISRTRIGQNEQEHNQENSSRIDHHDDYNYYTTRTQACCDAEMPGAEVMEKIAEAYRANINQMITGVAAGIIEQALRKGMEPATVILAIQETGMAPRPSPYYLAAILRNWAETGVVLSRSRGGADVSTTQARPWWR